MDRIFHISQKEVSAFCEILKRLDGFFFFVKIDVCFSIFTNFDMSVLDNHSILATECFDDVDVVGVKSMGL